MACIDCENCTRVTPGIPQGGTGTITIGTITDTNTTVIVEVVKDNGRILYYPTTSDGSGLVTFLLSDFTTDDDFFAPHAGYYRLRILSDSMVEYTITDGSASTATCMLFEVVADTTTDPDITLEITA